MSQAMEDKFSIRRYHGGPPAWKAAPLGDIVAVLYRELDELEGALAMESKVDIMWEAVDVANACMMIAEKCGLMERRDA